MKRISSIYHQEHWSTDRPWCVYMHKSPSGSVYIGITSRKRLSVRFVNGQGYKSCTAFNNCIKKYGWANIEHYILNEGLTEDEAKNLEIEYIAQYRKTTNVYNITSGGQGARRPCREETKRKISESQKGRKFTHEHIEKLSSSHIGKTLSYEQKAKISMAVKRYCMDPKNVAVRSASLRGRKTIHKGMVVKRAPIGELQKYLDCGWDLGCGRSLKRTFTMPKSSIERMRAKKTGMIWICHETLPAKQIRPDELNVWLNKGYKKGRNFHKVH